MFPVDLVPVELTVDAHVSIPAGVPLFAFRHFLFHSTFVIVIKNQPEVSTLSRCGILPLSGSLQVGIRFFGFLISASPSASLAGCFPLRGGYGLTMFRLKIHSERFRFRLFAGVACLRTGSIHPVTLHPCLLAQACQYLWLVQTSRRLSAVHLH